MDLVTVALLCVIIFLMGFGLGYSLGMNKYD